MESPSHAGPPDQFKAKNPPTPQPYFPIWCTPQNIKDSEFWRRVRSDINDLARRQKEVLLVDSHELWFRAYCNFSSDPVPDGYCRYKTQGGLAELKGDLTSAMRSIASGLRKPPEVEAVDFVLCCLGRDLLMSRVAAVRAEFRGQVYGHIPGLLSSLAGYCSRSAAEADEQEAGSRGHDSAAHTAPAGREEEPREDSTPPIAGSSAAKKALLAKYKQNCKGEGFKATNAMIAKTVCPGWNTRTPIEKWAANDPRHSTPANDRRILKVLTGKPQRPSK